MLSGPPLLKPSIKGMESPGGDSLHFSTSFKSFLPYNELTKNRFVKCDSPHIRSINYQPREVNKEKPQMTTCS